MRLWRRHAHDHAVEAITYTSPGFGAPATTVVLYRCPCGRPGHLTTETLIGKWTLEQVTSRTLGE